MRPVRRMSKEGGILAAAAFVIVAVAVGLAVRGGARDPMPGAPKAPGGPPAGTRAHATHRTWRQVEQGMSYVRLKDVDWFLLNTRIPDFGDELSRAEGVGEDPAGVAGIDGCYDGEVKLGDGRKWRMSTDVSVEKGSTDVVLSEDGAIFMHTMGGEGLRDLRRFGRDSTAVILEASESVFFQLYPFRKLGLIGGNLYLGSEAGKIEFGGTVLLRKGKCRED